MFRFILTFLGAIFSTAVNGAIMGALTVGAVIWVFSLDLPDHNFLSQYRPATVTRIYSTEGRVIDEFADERRIFVPSEDIPDVVKQAFVSAEDKNFYQHPGYDLRGIGAAVYEAFASNFTDLRG
ncbi:MAG: transglycosylase domain-containing protein, partial [Pseudomonadota bacterium]